MTMSRRYQNYVLLTSRSIGGGKKVESDLLWEERFMLYCRGNGWIHTVYTVDRFIYLIGGERDEVKK